MYICNKYKEIDIYLPVEAVELALVVEVVVFAVAVVVVFVVVLFVVVVVVLFVVVVLVVVVVVLFAVVVVLDVVVPIIYLYANCPNRTIFIGNYSWILLLLLMLSW